MTRYTRKLLAGWFLELAVRADARIVAMFVRAAYHLAKEASHDRFRKEIADLAKDRADQ